MDNRALIEQANVSAERLKQPLQHIKDPHQSAPAGLLGAATTVFLELLVEGLLAYLPTLLVPFYAVHLHKLDPHGLSFV